MTTIARVPMTTAMTNMTDTESALTIKAVVTMNNLHKCEITVFSFNELSDIFDEQGVIAIDAVITRTKRRCKDVESSDPWWVQT